MVDVLQGRLGEGRRILGRALENRDSASIPEPIRGLMIAGDGWAQLLQGDSVGGISRMRAGLDLSASPNEETAFPRLQLALSLADRGDTRAEGIRWLTYGFDMLPLYKPLTLLALGHAYEAAGVRDSASRHIAGSSDCGTRQTRSCRAGYERQGAPWRSSDREQSR